MYKTVRHGENSLQYTILPQEEGITNVKSEKSRRRGKTAVILTITIILVCGVVATAVLVPLLLTSDLVILPSAFQKFSVSSLRRTHSGNHIVVVAKKPHGWINSHRNANNLAYTPKPNYTHISVMEQKRRQHQRITSNFTTSTATTIPTTKLTKLPYEKSTTALENDVKANTPDDNKMTMGENSLKIYDDNRTEAPLVKSYIEISTTTGSSKRHELTGDGVMKFLNTNVQTTSSPWYHQRWTFGDTVSYVRWTGSNVKENFVTVVVGSIIVFLSLTIIFIIWMKRRRKQKNDSKNNAIDGKTGDKDTLLKESAAGSEEE